MGSGTQEICNTSSGKTTEEGLHTVNQQKPVFLHLSLGAVMTLCKCSSVST